MNNHRSRPARSAPMRRRARRLPELREQIQEAEQPIEVIETMNDALQAELSDLVATRLVTRLDEVNERLQRIEKGIAALNESSTQGTAALNREFFNTREAASVLGLAVWTTRNYLRTGRIHGERANTKRGEDREWRASREELLYVLEHGLRPPQYPT